MLCFDFFAFFNLTVNFAIFNGHIELEILAKFASLQSHTKPYVEEYDMEVEENLIKTKDTRVPQKK